VRNSCDRQLKSEVSVHPGNEGNRLSCRVGRLDGDVSGHNYDSFQELLVF